MRSLDSYPKMEKNPSSFCPHGLRDSGKNKILIFFTPTKTTSIGLASFHLSQAKKKKRGSGIKKCGNEMSPISLWLFWMLSYSMLHQSLCPLTPTRQGNLTLLSAPLPPFFHCIFPPLAQDRDDILLTSEETKR